MLSQELSKAWINVNLPDSVPGLGGQFLPIPDATTNVDHTVVQIQISDMQARCLSDSHTGTGQQCEQDAVLAFCPLNDLSQLFFCEITLLWIFGLPQVQLPGHPNLFSENQLYRANDI